MKIRNSLLKSLNIKQEEERKFLLLFFHSFFLGLFVAYYFLTANTLFIQHFGSENLPYAYIVAGFIGYIVSVLYSGIQARFSSRTLLLVTTGLMCLVPLILRIGVFFVPLRWLSLFVFAWAWPFISLVGTLSGGLALQKLDLRQVKRLFSLINIGGVAASIVGYLSVPLLSKVFTGMSDYLLVSSVGAALSVLMLLRVYKEFPDKKKVHSANNKLSVSPKLFTLLKDKYFVYIFIAAVFSMTSIYLVDFGFLSGIKSQNAIFSDTKKVSQFIALVFAGLKVGELISSLYSGRLLTRFGIRFGLVILPLTISALMLIGSMSGLIWGNQSLVLFVILVLSKTAERIIRRSLDDPSFNVLYQPMHDDQQLAIQAKVAQVIQFSIAIAGVILIAFKYILTTDNGFQIRLFPLALLPVVALWLFFSVKLYNQYRTKLRQILLERNKETNKNSFRFRYGDEILRRKLKPFEKKKSRLATVILAEANPRQLLRYCIPLLREQDSVVTPALLKSVTPFFSTKFANEIDKNLSAVILQDWQRHIQWARAVFQTTESPEDLPEYAELAVIQKLSKLRVISSEDISPFFYSKFIRIKRIAVELFASQNESTDRKRIVDLLTDVELRDYVADVITEHNQDLLSELERLFNESHEKSLLLKIVEIMAKIGTLPARLFLVKNIDYPDRDIQIATIKSLFFCRFEADETTRPKIIDKIQQIIRNILWISVAMKEIEDKLNTLKLLQSLELDKADNYELLFNLLSFLNSPSTVELIKKNIIGENVIFALEIIENFMTADIKTLIVPLFENTPIWQKIKRYEAFVKIPKLKLNDRLSEIICSDYYIIDDWTRAKAIELVGRDFKRKKSSDINKGDSEQQNFEIKTWETQAVQEILSYIRKSEMPDEIFVALYHPNELVYSTAAKIIYEENPSRCLSYIKSLSEEKQFLRTIFDNINSREHLLIVDKLKFLKRHLLFFNVPEKLLVKIAAILTPLEIKKDTILDMTSDVYSKSVIIVMDGLLGAVGNTSNKNFQKNDVVLLDINFPLDETRLKAKRNTFVFIADRAVYFNLLLDESEILYYIFDDI